MSSFQWPQLKFSIEYEDTINGFKSKQEIIKTYNGEYFINLEDVLTGVKIQTSPKEYGEIILKLNT